MVDGCGRDHGDHVGRYPFPEDDAGALWHLVALELRLGVNERDLKIWMFAPERSAMILLTGFMMALSAETGNLEVPLLEMSSTTNVSLSDGDAPVCILHADELVALHGDGAKLDIVRRGIHLLHKIELLRKDDGQILLRHGCSSSSSFSFSFLLLLLLLILLLYVCMCMYVCMYVKYVCIHRKRRQ